MEGIYTARQRELIDKHRDINVKHHNWWDCTYDDFKSEMAPTGVDVVEMQFSGFWSQGDGASFVGSISIKLFMEHHKLTETYPIVMRLLMFGGECVLKVDRQSHHYVHENTVRVYCPYYDGFRAVLWQCNDDLRAAVIRQWDDDLETEITALTEAATDIIRGNCRDLYRQLEEEYNYLTDDAAVWETIQANDLDKEEDE